MDLNKLPRDQIEVLREIFIKAVGANCYTANDVYRFICDRIKNSEKELEETCFTCAKRLDELNV